MSSVDRGATIGFVWRLSWGPILIASAVVGLSLWLFWDGLSILGEWWTSDPEYSYCVLIPPVAAFLVWQQKDRLEQLPFEGSWLGVSLVLLGGGLLLLGQLATVYTLVQYAYLVTLYGLILSFTGRRAFRLLAVRPVATTASRWCACLFARHARAGSPSVSNAARMSPPNSPTFFRKWIFC